MQISKNKCIGICCMAFRREHGKNGMIDAEISECIALEKCVGGVVLCPMHMYARDGILPPEITDKVKCRERGNYMRRILRDGDMVAILSDTIAYSGEKIERGRIGIVHSARSPKVTYNPYSDDPEERRMVFAAVTVASSNKSGYEICAPRYCDLYRVGKKDICEHVN